MKTRALLPLGLIPAVAVVILALAPLAAHAASNNDFDSVVSALEQRYAAHAQHMPMIGLVSLCARAATDGGVKNMRVTEFDNIPKLADTSELEQLLSTTLGDEWQRFVTTREANGAVSLIFVRPNGAAMRMLIADYQNGELDLVRVELNGQRLKLWMHNPHDAAHHHHN
jgi:hypothetical protein